MLCKIGRILILALLLVNSAFAATSSKVICVNSKGDIFLRGKCKDNEKLLSSELALKITTTELPAGPVGPQGQAGIIGSIGVVGPVGPVGSQGPQGAQGPIGAKGESSQINFSACRLSSQGYDTNFSNPANPILYAEAYCNPNTEFLLQDEAKINFFSDSVGSKVALQSRSPFYHQIGSDKREYAVGYFVNRLTTVGSGIFELLVLAVCCPR